MMSANDERLFKRARRKLVPAGLWSRGMIATLGAQFLSAFGDNALLFAALALVRKQGYPIWSGPLLQAFFVIAYIVLAPIVGVLADAHPKGGVMFYANIVKFVGASGMCLHLNPFVCYALIGGGAAANSPAKYGILGEFAKPDQLVKANSLLEASTIAAILLGALAGWSIVAAQIRIVGPENPDTLLSQSNLAAMLIQQGRFAEAEQIARKTYEVQLRHQGPQNVDTLEMLKQLGKAIAHQHRYAEASDLFRDAIDNRMASGPNGNTRFAWYGFASVAMAADRTTDALRYLREAVSHGYQDSNGLMADDDLKSLRSNPDFLQIVAELTRAPARGSSR